MSDSVAKKHPCLVYIADQATPVARFSNVKAAISSAWELRHVDENGRKREEPLLVMVVTPQESFMEDEIDFEYEELCR